MFGKKITLFLLLGLSVFSSNGFSQYGLGFGYQGAYAPLDSLNFIHHRYNETRVWLGDTMRPMHGLHGPTLSYTVGLGKVAINARWSFLHQRRNATGAPALSSVVGERQVRLRYNTLNMGVYIPFNQAKLSAGLTTGLNFGTVKYHTRSSADLTTIKDEDWTKVIGKASLGASFGFRISYQLTYKFWLAFSPNIQMQFWDTDFSPVNEAINPVTFVFDPTRIGSNPINVQLPVTLIFNPWN